MAKTNYVAVSGLSLSPSNIKKLHKHQGTIIKPTSMGSGEMEIYVSPMKAKKMVNSMKKGKGMKLTLTPDELEHTMKHGKGVMLPSRKIFNVAKEGMPVLIKKGVIAHKSMVDTGDNAFQVVRGDPLAPSAPPKTSGRKKKTDEPVEATEGETEGGRINLKDVGRVLKKGFEGYKKYVKPIVGDEIRSGLKQAVKAGVPALASAVLGPEALPVATMLTQKFGDKAVDALGDATGAFGMGMKPSLSDTYNNFLNPLHPAMNPSLPPMDNSLTRGGSFKSAGYGIHGGSFKSAGYGIHGGSFMSAGYGRLRGHIGSGVEGIGNIQPLGSALNPQLPPEDNSLPR